VEQSRRKKELRSKAGCDQHHEKTIGGAVMNCSGFRLEEIGQESSLVNIFELI
jgi:hypothetical protein